MVVIYLLYQINYPIKEDLLLRRSYKFQEAKDTGYISFVTFVQTTCFLATIQHLNIVLHLAKTPFLHL